MLLCIIFQSENTVDESDIPKFELFIPRYDRRFPTKEEWEITHTYTGVDEKEVRYKHNSAICVISIAYGGL